MAFVPVKPRRKPFWGNVALALALVTINGLRITAFLLAAGLSAKGNLLDLRRYR